ncbi:MAG TPA: hypothetical protein VD867_10080 [Burkholderiales bacterium]|nr:hypothetical protein [Burkholderiales bacterium]
MRVLLVVLTMFSLSACGYKAALFLPQAKAEKGKKPAAAIVTPEPAPDRPVPSEAVPAVR